MDYRVRALVHVNHRENEPENNENISRFIYVFPASICFYLVDAVCSACGMSSAIYEALLSSEAISCVLASQASYLQGLS